MYLQGCYSTGYYRMVNQDQLLTKHGYQRGNMNFKMRSSDLNSPMFSRKGQVNLELNTGGGWGGSLSIAATDKLGIYFKGSSRTAEDIFKAYDTMIYESSNNGEYWTGPYKKTVGIETTHDLRNGFFETGFGTYKMNMAKNLRYDLFGVCPSDQQETLTI
jgi:hypothetical protein